MKKRPWIKVLNEKGKCLVRCKDPRLACIYFVDFQYRSGVRAFPGELAHKLFIDGIEYNPPIHTTVANTSSYPMQWTIPTKVRKSVMNDMDYILETHKAFYS